MKDALSIADAVGSESFLALLGLAYVASAALLLYEYLSRATL
jgi:hypothetical protein